MRISEFDRSLNYVKMPNHQPNQLNQFISSINLIHSHLDSAGFLTLPPGVLKIFNATISVASEKNRPKHYRK